MALTHIANVKNFVSTHITGGKKDFVPDEEATRIDNKYGEIKDELTQQRGELERIDEETRLRPPALKNFKNYELVAGGALAGAAVGGAIGLSKELLTSVASNPQVEVTEVEHSIYRTELRDVGEPWTEASNPQYDHNGSLTGWQHVYTASLEQKEIGTYTERTAEIKGAGSGNPLTAGLSGMLIGGALGAGVGLAVMVSRNFIPDGKYQEYERRKTTGDAKVLLKFGAAGGALGAGAGLLSAALESRHNGVETFQTETPRMEREVIGQIPGQDVVQNGNGQFQTGWFETVRGTGANNPGNVNVEVDNPVQSGLLNRPQVNKEDVSIEVSGRYSYLTGMLGGMAVGVGAGIATGVLVNVIRKTI